MNNYELKNPNYCVKLKDIETVERLHYLLLDNDIITVDDQLSKDAMNMIDRLYNAYTNKNKSQ